MSNPPPIYRDPWAKKEAWRKHPVFARGAMLSKMFPGFGIAVVAFTTYVIAENILAKEKKPSH
ncbi:hypothetical protein A0H81_09214 [Grifola frondosa]|uniref:NADH dehydrogenase [ubiquinone] 1 beta subcomplex subunit 3 n=1 Tax=Grifola frondosa TaxID=5627 RepID=A0A1C7M206_GRIFR|nr:hypothetical protein A0H81_09214 [Grifola frondosa]